MISTSIRYRRGPRADSSLLKGALRTQVWHACGVYLCIQNSTITYGDCRCYTERLFSCMRSNYTTKYSEGCSTLPEGSIGRWGIYEESKALGIASTKGKDKLVTVKCGSASGLRQHQTDYE